MISSSDHKEVDKLKDIMLEVDVRDFASFYGMDTKTAYNRVKEALLGLMKKPYILDEEREGRKVFEAVALLKNSGYVEGQGYAIVEIDRRMRSLLTNLTECYTSFQLKYILMLHANPIRFYEFCKSWESAHFRKIRASDLRQQLGLERKYKQNADFRKIVIDPAIKEINIRNTQYLWYQS